MLGYPALMRLGTGVAAQSLGAGAGVWARQLSPLLNVGHHTTMSSSCSPVGISRHFRREAKLMVVVVLAVLLLGVLAAIFGPHLVQFVAVDKCLDAGGAFDYANSTCQFGHKAPHGSSPAGK